MKLPSTALSFDWKRMARYCFTASICCLALAAAALANQSLATLLQRLAASPAAMKSFIFGAVAALLFWWGITRRRRYSDQTHRNEAVLFLGVLALATAVGFLGSGTADDTDYSTRLLIASLCYLVLGLQLPSRQVWIFALFSAAAWIGSETTDLSYDGAYFLGMNYPLRYVLFGAALTAFGIWSQRSRAAGKGSAGKERISGRVEDLKQRLAYLSPQTKVVGLAILFLALWVMSIFGNQADPDVWEKIPQYQFLQWTLLILATSLAAVWYGLRNDDRVARGFGLTFLFISFYTSLFEYLWDGLPKALFFTLLALSFWVVGRAAERIRLASRTGSGAGPTE